MIVPLSAFFNKSFVFLVAFIILALIIGTFFPLIKVTAIVFSFFIISPGAKVISGSFVNAPIGLNFPDVFTWNFNNSFASDFVNVLPDFNFDFICLNVFVFGNC